MKGYLFVFEGADGVGKTTIIENLKSKFDSQNRSVKTIGFPGYKKATLGNLVYQIHITPKNIDISAIDSTSLQLLHIAAHIDSINNEIIPSLERGDIIFLDRYWWSTYVYGKIYGVEESVLKQMINIEKHFWRNYLPSTLFLIKSPKEPYKLGLDIKLWEKIVSEYNSLSQFECKFYPVEAILNSQSIDLSLNKIMKSITEIMK